MSSPNMQLIESRVDWITATSLYNKTENPDLMQEAIVLGADMLREAEARGERLRRFTMHDFGGLQAGGVAVGQSKLGMLFRLSGDSAANHWKDVHSVSTNVSRIDLAATFRVNGAWRDMSYVHLQELDDWRRKHNPRLKRHRIDGGKDGNSLSVGSRSSDVYGRIYDKGAESGLEFYQDCWRYEIELKRSRALIMADTLCDQSSNSGAEAEHASQWFVTHGIDVPGLITFGALPCSCPRPTTDDNSVAWLRRGVSGTAARLIERGRLLDVLDALKLSASVLRGAGYVYQPNDRKE